MENINVTKRISRKIMKKIDILNAGLSVEPECFETEREDQWYHKGLYDGANATPWNSIFNDGLPPIEEECLFFCNGVIGVGHVDKNNKVIMNSRFVTIFKMSKIEYWMKIPEIPKL